jgi:hypothetical protein
MSVSIRIEGTTEAEIRQAATRMGVVVRSIYRKRDRRGFMGYGYLPNAAPTVARTNVTAQVRPPVHVEDDDCPF